MQKSKRGSGQGNGRNGNIAKREEKCSVAKSRNKSSKDVHHLEQMRIRMALRDHQGQKVFVEKTRVWEHFKE